MSGFKMGSRDTSYESNFSNVPTTMDDKQKLANVQVRICFTTIIAKVSCEPKKKYGLTATFHPKIFLVFAFYL
jgi:hypothetical protein